MFATYAQEILPSKKWCHGRCYSCVQKLSGGTWRQQPPSIGNTTQGAHPDSAKLSFWHRTLSSEVQHCPEASIAKKKIIHHFLVFPRHPRQLKCCKLDPKQTPMLITKRRPLNIAGIRHVQLSHPKPQSCKLFALGASAASGSHFWGSWDKPPNFGGNCQMVCNQVTGVIRSSCRHVASQLLGTLFLELKLLLNSLFLLPFLGQKIFFLVGCPKPPCFITGAEFLNNSVASLKDQIMNRSHPKAMTIAAVLRGTSSSPSTFNLKNHVLQQFQQHRFNESNQKKKHGLKRGSKTLYCSWEVWWQRWTQI